MKNGVCDDSQFSSADGVCSTHIILLDKVGSRGSRMVCACSRDLSRLFLDDTDSVSVGKLPSVCPLLPVRHLLD